MSHRTFHCSQSPSLTQHTLRLLTEELVAQRAVDEFLGPRLAWTVDEVHDDTTTGTPITLAKHDVVESEFLALLQTAQFPPPHQLPACNLVFFRRVDRYLGMSFILMATGLFVFSDTGAPYQPLVPARWDLVDEGWCTIEGQPSHQLGYTRTRTIIGRQDLVVLPAPPTRASTPTPTPTPTHQHHYDGLGNRCFFLPATQCGVPSRVWTAAAHRCKDYGYVQRRSADRVGQAGTDVGMQNDSRTRPSDEEDDGWTIKCMGVETWPGFPAAQARVAYTSEHGCSYACQNETSHHVCPPEPTPKKGEVECARAHAGE